MHYTPADGFPYYFDLTGRSDLRGLFLSDEVFRVLNSITEEEAGFRYANDKWSIRQVIGHITDHERIKMHRAFLLSRKQQVELWGYDQDTLVANSRFDELPLQLLITDLRNTRNASISFIDTLSQKQLLLKAMARAHEITLGDFLRSVIGHERHHLNIIRDRYLIGGTGQR